ncbi:MAG TPA: glycosyltransferase family 4 protein [Chitinophagaceae bacterium]|nr:glycosyltransferase family 4 protein [Chitinophagaceae bacterium]
MSAAKKIKVLECIRQGQIGGGESHLLSLVENLDKDKYEPVVLSFSDGPMITRLQQMGIKTHVIYTEKPFDITKWSRVKQLLKEENIELIHAHGTRANSNILWAARSLQIPVIYTIHGWSFHQDQHPLIRSIRILGEKYLTSRSDINISVSASNKRSGEHYIKAFKSIVVNNGIDTAKFSPAGTFKNIRQELNIPADAVLVIFIARFTHQKQPLALIRAFQEVLVTVPDLRLLMVGDGDQKQEALEMVNTPDIKDKIYFQSFRQDVPDLLAAADIFVLPSLWEGLPIGLLEAMAMGKAIIATDVDGTKEVIRHRENGLLVKVGRVAMLASALSELGKDQSLREALRQKALETVRQQFDAKYMTREIETIYKKAAHGI